LPRPPTTSFGFRSCSPHEANERAFPSFASSQRNKCSKQTGTSTTRPNQAFFNSLLGVSREKHHRYLLNDPATTGVLFCAGSDCVGYSYIGSNGHIGPLAVTRPDILRDAFTTALKLAAEGSAEKISAFLPGTGDSALSLAVNQGMRITFPMLLMASVRLWRMDAASTAKSRLYVISHLLTPCLQQSSFVLSPAAP
jgi:hypothetical protein